MEAIWNLYKDNPRVKVMSYNQLTVDFAKEVGAGFILRGIRTVNDFEYHVFIAEERGDKYRWISTGITIHDAFRKQEK